MMDGTQITTAHLAVFVAAGGVVTSVGTALALFLLQRLFGTGDKAGAEIDELKDKVHGLELAVEKSQLTAREHIADRYATREDMRRLEGVIQAATENMNARMSEYTAAVTAVLGPIGEQLGVNAVRGPHR
jgi:hypothetical protein